MIIYKTAGFSQDLTCYLWVSQCTVRSQYSPTVSGHSRPSILAATAVVEYQVQLFFPTAVYYLYRHRRLGSKLTLETLVEAFHY